VLLEVNNKPLFLYPLQLFKKFNFEIVCVINENDLDYVLPYLDGIKYVFGGKTRAESVRNGLKEVTGEYVLIHDAARAFLDKNTVNEIINNIDLSSAILTYLDVKDTIKIKNADKYETLNRNMLIAAATPQAASTKNLRYVYDLALKENYESTDDISLIEKYLPDLEIRYIKANDEDFKITTQLDLKLAKIVGGEK
jgi:2-C-methyl-D-erythritol 4-phosphate cytidylyltransferase